MKFRGQNKRSSFICRLTLLLVIVIGISLYMVPMRVHAEIEGTDESKTVSVEVVVIEEEKTEMVPLAVAIPETKVHRIEVHDLLFIAIVFIAGYMLVEILRQQRSIRRLRKEYNQELESRPRYKQEKN